MSAMYEDKQLSTSQWWLQKSLDYNAGIVVSGLTLFVSFIIITLCTNAFIVDTGFKITLFSIFVQSLCFLFFMGVANIVYLLGPAVEKMVKPKNITDYRMKTYTLFDVTNYSPYMIIACIYIYFVYIYSLWG